MSIAIQYVVSCCCVEAVTRWRSNVCTATLDSEMVNQGMIRLCKQCVHQAEPQDRYSSCFHHVTGRTRMATASLAVGSTLGQRPPGASRHNTGSPSTAAAAAAMRHRDIRDPHHVCAHTNMTTPSDDNQQAEHCDCKLTDSNTNTNIKVWD